uniref:Lipid A biosynthesis acyltransferase n=1 Tax=viral metagenome TaxID=1070528 RepID=A0A6C0EK83_9ZZZZ
MVFTFLTLSTIGLFILHKLYINYTLEIIYNVAYLLAFIPYYLNIRHKIIVTNLKIVFPDISDKRIDHIRFHSWKYFIINLLTCINQYLFRNSFLKKYYSINHIDVPHKSFFTAAHLGLYYDLTGFQQLTGKSVYTIYKGNFKLDFNGILKMVQHNNINLKELGKYFTVITPIDQKSNDKTIVKFLDQSVRFHSYLINISVRENRDIYLSFVIIKKYALELVYIKINTKDKTLEEIVQDVAYKYTDLIKQHPEQYLWSHNRFNI